MIVYVRKFEGNTTMSFKISDKQLLKKYNQIWKKVKSLLNIKFNSEPAKQKLPKENVSCKCLSIIMLDSVTKQRKVLSSNTFRKNVNMNQKR